MEKLKFAFLYQRLGRLKHFISFRWEASDYICTKRHAGSEAPSFSRAGNDIMATVPPFHSLKDKVMARLNAQMQVRHKSFIGR
tara:strand:- start:313 stop:561 length:249 start_codon:yes stop_codon:yes gene_type:complete